ncbi:hypothetical protein RYX36_032226 [Vicia faba]
MAIALTDLGTKVKLEGDINQEAYNNLGVLYRDAGDIALANNAYEQRLKIDPGSRNACQNRLLAMNYIDEGNYDKLFEAHRDWGRLFMRLYQPFTSWRNSKDPEGDVDIKIEG